MKVICGFLFLFVFWMNIYAQNEEANKVDSSSFAAIKICTNLSSVSDSRTCTANHLREAMWQKLDKKGSSELESGEYLLSYLVRSDKVISFDKIIRLPQSVGNRKFRETQDHLVSALEEVLQEQAWIYPEADGNYGVGVIDNLRIVIE